MTTKFPKGYLEDVALIEKAILQWALMRRATGDRDALILNLPQKGTVVIGCLTDFALDDIAKTDCAKVLVKSVIKETKGRATILQFQAALDATLGEPSAFIKRENN